MNDTLLLIGRVLIALLFLLTVILGSPNAGFLGSIGFPNPAAMSLLARVVEWIITLSLIFGAGTRYGAALGALYVIVATLTAHRFWSAAPAAWVGQYSNFSKNLAILGGFALVYASGAGAYSIDAVWTGRRTAAVS